MSLQGLQPVVDHIKDSLASIRSGFALGCAYDSGLVGWDDARALLVGRDGAADRVTAPADSAHRPERAAA